jgi:hypothetical protein
MPLYRNSTTERKTLNGVILEAGETKAMQTWFDPLPSGIVKDADAPMANPVIYSNKHTGAGTIAIPSGETRFNIHIAVISGEPVINFSSASNTPALKLYPGARWNIRCFERSINDIRLAAGTFEAWVIIERF